MSAQPGDRRRPLLPRSRIGRAALVVSALGFASWIVLPIVTVNFRTRFPVTDTWVMPAVVMAFVDAAAIVNALATWRYRERSVLNRAVTVVTVPAALLITLFLVGEGLTGV